MSNSENPLPPENDPIAALMEFNLEGMSEEELAKHVDKLHSAVNNPKELNRLISGKGKTKKKTSARTAHEKAFLNDLIAGL
jgi:hypothetical protein